MYNKLKTMIICGLAFLLCACSQQIDTSKQKQVVNDFFVGFNNGDMETVYNNIDSKLYDSLGFEDFEGRVSKLADSKVYGQTFAQEANAFKYDCYDAMISKTKIKEITVKDKTATVIVDAKLRKFSSFSVDTDKVETLASDYVLNHTDKLQEIYKSQGKDAMTKQVYSDIAKSLFNDFKNQINQVKPHKVTLTITLKKAPQRWKITKVAGLETILE